MAESSDSGEWKTPRLCDKKLAYRSFRNTEAGGPVDSDDRGMLLAAVVHPFTTGDNQSKGGDDVNNFIHRSRLHYPNIPSPYLLTTQGSTPTIPSQPHQTCSPSTPVSGLIGRPSPKSLTREHFRSFSPSSQEMELQSLRHQVQDIQSRLNGDVMSSSEYQQLLSEKVALEQILGATEHELQELKIAFGHLEDTAAQSEEEMSLKMQQALEKQQILLDKYNKTAEELRRLKDYIQLIPTKAEHSRLQREITKRSKQVTHLSEKVDLLSSQMAQLKDTETELEQKINTLSQEKEDLTMKLKLSENILTDIESQKAMAFEQGEDTMEDLLWRLDQHQKELSNAKKLLSYRKNKIESSQKLLIENERKYNEKVQREVENSEKLKETVWELKRELEEHKMNEQTMKTSIKNYEEKQKKMEEYLQVSLMQIKNHQEMNSTISSLFSNLHRAVFTLKDLVKISTQISQGITPDLSVLLSFTELDEGVGAAAVSLEDMKKRLTEIRELIQQLESIRLTLQDQHADQVAANMTCAQM